MNHATLLFLLLGACAASETATQKVAEAALQSAPETAMPVAATWLASEEITGSLEPLSAVQLGFDVPGRLVAVEVTRGQAVKKGDELGHLDDAMARAQLQQAEGARASAKAQLAAGEAGWTRTQALKDAGGLSDQQLADAEAGILAMRAGVEQAEAAVALARTNLSHHALRAPFDGVVTGAPDNAGAMVGAGTPLFVVEDLSALQVKGTVPDNTTWVVAGMAAKVTSGSTTADGEVARVIPSLDPATRRIPVEIVVRHPPAELRAHAFVRVRLQATESIPAFGVPKSALIARPDFSVFVTKDGKPERISVDVLGDSPEGPGVVLVRGDLPAGVPVLVNPPTGL